MRTLVMVCVMLASRSATAGPNLLAVPWIEAGPEDDEDVEYLAAVLTAALRSQTHYDTRFALPDDDRTLAQLKRHTKCEVVKTACLIVIAKELGGDTLVFGRIERNVLEGVEGYDVSLEALTVSSRTRRSWHARAPLTSIKTWITDTAPTAYAALVGAPRRPLPRQSACNSSPSIGDAYASRGNDLMALEEYERAYRCERDSLVAVKAFIAACNARNEAKARQYYPLMPPNMKSLRQRCVAQGIQIP